MKIRYEGPPALAGLVAQMLSDEGVPVTYTLKVEARGAMDVVEAVVIYMSVKAVDGLTGNIIDIAIERAKAELSGRFKGIKIRRED
jgi:hypothetical protein